MIRLHLSKETTSEVAATMHALIGYPLPDVEPACGARDDVPVLRRGTWAGLVPPAAVSPEFHCPACVVAIREGRR